MNNQKKSPSERPTINLVDNHQVLKHFLAQADGSPRLTNTWCEHSILNIHPLNVYVRHSFTLVPAILSFLGTPVNQFSAQQRAESTSHVH